MTNLFYKQLSSSLVNESDVFLFTIIAGNPNLIGEKLLLVGCDAIASNPFTMLFWDNVLQKIQLDQCPYVFTFTEDIQIFIQHISRKPNLLIFGAGHISTHLTKIANMINFDVTVIDDREDFANTDRFPDANKIYCMPFNEAISSITFTNNTYSVIVTRGHQNDRQCLEGIINKPNAYIGMIGSRKKIKLIKDTMINEGFNQDSLDKVYAPIGLKLDAETPEEIAVSIAAELIKVRQAASSLQYIEQDILEYLHGVNTPFVLATIISKTGSSPRDIGSRMIVSKDKKIIGTIGGGSLEHDIYNQALELLNSINPRPTVVTYNMNNTDAALTGMICGGTVEVFLDPVI